MEQIYEYIKRNPEYEPRTLPTNSLDTALGYVGGHWRARKGGGGGSSPNIIYSYDTRIVGGISNAGDAGMAAATHEYARWVIMRRLKYQFRQILPRSKRDHYSMWLYERLRHDTHDPIIPALKTRFISSIVSVEPYWDLTPDVAPMEKLRIAQELSEKNKDEVTRRGDAIENAVNKALAAFKVVEADRGASVRVDYKSSIIIMPNKALVKLLGGRGQGAALTVSPEKYGALKSRFIGGGSFNYALAAMLMRYSSVMDIRANEGVNMHAAVPPKVFAILVDEIGVSAEAFASPLNATLPRFLSAFPDVDAAFGSLGSFYKYDFGGGGSFEANPPFTDATINMMIDKINADLGAIALPLSFFVVVPNWALDCIKNVKNSPHTRWRYVAAAGKHNYLTGGQHIKSTAFIAPFETYLCLLQNEAGAKKWPAPQGFADMIMTAWSS